MPPFAFHFTRLVGRYVHKKYAPPLALLRLFSQLSFPSGAHLLPRYHSAILDRPSFPIIYSRIECLSTHLRDTSTDAHSQAFR